MPAVGEAKASAFGKSYAGVSKLNLTKDDRRVHRDMKRELRIPAGNKTEDTPFSMSELEEELRELRAGGAAGADEVCPRFIKQLGTGARTYLLFIILSDVRGGWLCSAYFEEG